MTCRMACPPSRFLLSAMKRFHTRENAMSSSAILMKQKQYEATIVDFLKKEQGHILLLSDDQSFVALLRMLLLKQLGLDHPPTIITAPEQLLQAIKEESRNHPNLIIFMERVMGGRSLSSMVRQFKAAYNNIRIIVLTHDVGKDQLMLLHEVGADNFIAKPVSANTLVEKMAFTLKPQSKLGELLDKAKVLIDMGNSEAALRLSERILEIKPNSAAGYLIKGDAYRIAGKLDEAREAYETASNHAELFMEPLRRLGELHAEMGDTANHLKYLERLDTLSPLNAERKVDMGVIHLTLGNDQKAADLFDTAVEQTTREALNQISDISNRIANLYAEKDPLTAEKYLRQSIEVKGKKLSRDDLNTFNLLGINLRKQGRWQDALVEYQKALRVAPDDENLHYNLAMAHAEGRDFGAARENMLKALALNSDLPRASATIAYNIGMVFMHAGGKEMAEKHLRIALELNPDSGLLKNALARLQ